MLSEQPPKRSARMKSQEPPAAEGLLKATEVRGLGRIGAREAGEFLPPEMKTPRDLGRFERGVGTTRGIMAHQYSLHPLCTLFPRMEGADFKALCDDIRENGLREPITTHDNMILDGGNRYRACIEAGVTPRFVKFAGGNLVSFVLSANMHRRHMSAGQQAAIVASAQDWAQAQPRGGDRKSDQSATLHLDRVADRAAQSGASVRTQKMADKVAREAPALAKKVAHGEISLPKAHEQVSAPKPALKVVASKAPTVESLQAENAALREELEAALDNARELSDLLEGYSTVEEGEHATAKEIAKLKGQIRTLETTRNQYMTTCNELKREVKTKIRRIELLERQTKAAA